MDKIKEAQLLADKMLDECICQVGDDKGALKDEPESVEKSEEDIKKAVSMREEKEVKLKDVPEKSKIPFKINRTRAAIKGDKLTSDEKSGKKRVKRVKESNQVATAQQKDTLFDKLERVIKDSDKLKTSITQEPTTEGSLTPEEARRIKKKFNSEQRSRIEEGLASWLRKKAGMSTQADQKYYASKGQSGDSSSSKFLKAQEIKRKAKELAAVRAKAKKAKKG